MSKPCFAPRPAIRTATAVLATLGCFVAMAQPPAPIAPIGKLVDAGGHRLHINCTGEGSPTVVMESGAGDLSMVWALVQPQVSKFTRACSYDRAGYAWSDAGPQPRTMAQIVYELHTALANAGEKGPYVMVGASFGGPLVRVFANTYPNDVSGVVLVDSVHENDFVILNDKAVRFRETSEGKTVPPVQTFAKTAAEPLVFKPIRSSKFDKRNPRSRLPADTQRIWMITRKQDRYSQAANSEFTFLPEELQKLYAQTNTVTQPLGKKPLIVLTRDGVFERSAQGMSIAELNTDRQALQAKLAELSSNSKLWTVKADGRELQLYQPDITASAIRAVVDAVKARAPLEQAKAQ